MSITTLQAQIKQLRSQLKISKSPKQSKMLEEAVARLEKKLAEEKQKAAAQPPKLEIIASATPKASKRVTASKSKQTESKKNKAKGKKDEKTLDTELNTELEKSTDEAKTDSPSTENPQEKSTRTQELINGKILKAARGQGQHQFIWLVYATVEEIEPKKFIFTVDDGQLSLPAKVFHYRYDRIKDELPFTRYCTVYPHTKHGELTGVTLATWGQTEPREEEISAQGLWIPDNKKLVIQSDFDRWKKFSKNFEHFIPLADGLEIPDKGFKGFRMKREGTKLLITEECPVQDIKISRNPNQKSSATETLD